MHKIKNTTCISVQVLMFSITALLMSFSALGQSNGNWIDQFHSSDKAKIEEIDQQIMSYDIDLIGYFGTSIFDSIITQLTSKQLPSAKVFSTLKERTQFKKELAQVFKLYVNGSTPFIDSVPDFKISLELNSTFINDENSKLPNLYSELDQASDTSGMIEAIYKIDAALDVIILNSKQLFTFFSLAGKSQFIQKGDIQKEITPAIPSSEPDPTPILEPITTEEPTFANVVINDEVVESIQVSLANYKEDTTSIIYNLTTKDLDRLLEVWNRYLYEEEFIEENLETDNSEVELVENLDILPKDAEPNHSEELSNETTKSSREPQFTMETSSPDNIEEFVTEENVKEANNETVANAQTTNNSDKKTPSEIVQEKPIETKPENKKTEVEATNENISKPVYRQDPLIFRVQIAANKTPLKEEKLSKIYNGARQINMFQEEGWYKYYIADCQTLKEAISIRKECMVADAFVMAYKNGIKVKYYLKYIKGNKGSTPPMNFIDLKSLSSNKTVIVVQIAADKKPLSEKRLKEIYKGNRPINYIYEEGWHKYSFGNYDRFWPANIARRECETPGAFVVAYKNGSKIDLWAEKQEN